ncbi:MAG: hypothetical protein IPK82_36455 [Polyangiaceae bacterium]|nr:hypothetical protein [Polyangiaceae bacterium]
MSALLWVDGFFAEFCNALAGTLRDEARRLSYTLGFAPEPYVPWSAVFTNEITLAAPAMFAEAMPNVPRSAVEHALYAHALAVIEAMGRDRVEDGQVQSSAALERVLSAAREVRNEQLVMLSGSREAIRTALAADRELRAAIADEHDMVAGGSAVDFGTYESVSERKQQPGLVATTMLAERAGMDPAACESIRRAVLDIALALQIYDDVVDWEDDAARGRSWALSLARSALRPPARGVATDPVGRRAEVHVSGVLTRMLRRARFHFHAAARRARGVGSRRASTWASDRARALEDLAERESKHAGYVNRAHALAPWARAVLAVKV